MSKFLKRIKSRFALQLDPNIQDWQVLFSRKKEGIKVYRIPGILVCPNNIVLAFCEARKDSGSDFGEIYLAMRRSLDGGNTWEPIRLIWRSGNLAVQNPCPVYIEEENEIVMPFIVDRCKPHIIRSKDMGRTWSDAEPINELYMPEWGVNGCCPGHSIRLKGGRIITPYHHNTGSKEEGGVGKSRILWQSHLTYSDDKGKTWNRGHIWNARSDECMAVETADGKVLTILRQHPDNEKSHHILQSWSKDEGISSSKPEISEELIGPICMASIIKYPFEIKGNRNCILFSNPNNKEGRINLTIKLSMDGGKTWPYSKTLFPGKSSYSDLAVLNDGTICCIFEGGIHTATDGIIFARFKINWVME